MKPGTRFEPAGTSSTWRPVLPRILLLRVHSTNHTAWCLQRRALQRCAFATLVRGSKCSWCWCLVMSCLLGVESVVGRGLVRGRHRWAVEMAAPRTLSSEAWSMLACMATIAGASCYERIQRLGIRPCRMAKAAVADSEFLASMNGCLIRNSPRDH